jgi:hypothetical protein
MRAAAAWLAEKSVRLAVRLDPGETDIEELAWRRTQLARHRAHIGEARALGALSREDAAHLYRQAEMLDEWP